MGIVDPVGSPIRGASRAAVVNSYYNDTWFEYSLLWMTRRHRGMHLGLWDHGVRRHAASLVRTNEVLADAAAIRPRDRVLDAGCGVGGSSMWLATNRDAVTTGVDIVGSAVTRARRFASQRGLADRCTFLHADYCDLPVDDGSFDVVWALESMCHVPDMPRFLAEAFRVLRPGGRLVIGDFLRTRRPHPPDDEARLADFLDGWAMADLYTADELQEAARAIGFVDLEATDSSTLVARSARRLYRMGTALLPGETLLHMLGIRSRAAHHNTRSSRTVWTTLQRHLWCWVVTVGRKP